MRAGGQGHRKQGPEALGADPVLTPSTAEKIEGQRGQMSSSPASQ